MWCRDAKSRSTACRRAPAKSEPSLPPSNYAGDYADPWFGTIHVRYSDDKLIVDFPNWRGVVAELDHWQHDTFRTRFSDTSIEPAYLTFQLDSGGKVERITMAAISPVADPSFDFRDLLFTPIDGK